MRDPEKRGDSIRLCLGTEFYLCPCLDVVIDILLDEINDPRLVKNGSRHSVEKEQSRGSGGVRL